MEAAIIVLAVLAFGFWHAHEKKKQEQRAAAITARARQADREEIELAFADKAETKDRLLKSQVEQHSTILLLKREQGSFVDEYGVADNTSWMRDLRKFVERVVSDDIKDYYFSIGFAPDTALKMIECDVEIALLNLSRVAPKPGYSEDMSGVGFEKLVADRLSQMGANVNFTPQSGDQGVDLVVRFEGQTIVVQCKRSASTVGNRAVQEAYAGRKFYDAEQAWVVSDAPFSRHARQLASSLSVRLIHLNEVEEALIP